MRGLAGLPVGGCAGCGRAPQSTAYGLEHAEHARAMLCLTVWMARISILCMAMRRARKIRRRFAETDYGGPVVASLARNWSARNYTPKKAKRPGCGSLKIL